MSAGSSINDRIHGEASLEATFGFEWFLGRMDGVKTFAYNLWHYPDGLDYEDVDREAESEEYLQCAGSAAALTVELRERSGDGYDHWVLATAPVTGERDHTITWDEDFSTQVHAEEVFTSSEAAPLFEEYYRTGSIPDSVPRWRL